MNKHFEIRDQLARNLDEQFDGSLDDQIITQMSFNHYKSFRSVFRSNLYRHIVNQYLTIAAGDLYGYLKAKEVVSGTARADFRV